MPAFDASRSSAIQAPREQVYATVRDFRHWPAWSPWLRAEPECPIEFAPDGTSYSWNGTIVGGGTITITEEDPNQAISYRLELTKPWKSTSRVGFSFGERDGVTEVTWTMEGSLPFFLFWMKPMMSAWVGMDYERGLAMLKDFIETGSVPSELDFAGETSFPGISYLGCRTRCAIADIGPSMEETFGRVKSWFDAQSIASSGNAFSIYHRWNMARGVAEYTAGYPVSEGIIPSEVPKDFVSGNIPACRAEVIRHTGPYRHLGNAWSAGMTRAQANVFRQNHAIDPFEVYENDLDSVAETELVTSVHFPVK